MKKHIVLISVGVMNVLHGSFHLIQFIQSMFFVAYATNEHHNEGIIDTIMCSPIFALIMGAIGIFTLVIGIKDYRHHKKCETEEKHHHHEPKNMEEYIIYSDSDKSVTIEKIRTNKTKVVSYIVGDLDHPMRHGEKFKTKADAIEMCDREFTNRDKKDGHDDYWRNRRTGVWKLTEIKELLYDNKGNIRYKFKK